MRYPQHWSRHFQTPWCIYTGHTSSCEDVSQCSRDQLWWTDLKRCVTWTNRNLLGIIPNQYLNSPQFVCCFAFFLLSLFYYQGSVLRTSLITSEIKWQIQDDIIALIRIWLIRFFERTCCWWLVWLDWVIWWFKRGYASILETTISNVAIGWWQDSNVMTSYH